MSDANSKTQSVWTARTANFGPESSKAVAKAVLKGGKPADKSKERK